MKNLSRFALFPSLVLLSLIIPANAVNDCSTPFYSDCRYYNQTDCEANDCVWTFGSNWRCTQNPGINGCSSLNSSGQTICDASSVADIGYNGERGIDCHWDIWCRSGSTCQLPPGICPMPHLLDCREITESECLIAGCYWVDYTEYGLGVYCVPDSYCEGDNNDGCLLESNCEYADGIFDCHGCFWGGSSCLLSNKDCEEPMTTTTTSTSMSITTTTLMVPSSTISLPLGSGYDSNDVPHLIQPMLDLLDATPPIIFKFNSIIISLMMLLIVIIALVAVGSMIVIVSKIMKKTGIKLGKGGKR